MKKISRRAMAILSAISLRCVNGSYWLPIGNGRGCDDWSDLFQKFINISGAGDARALVSLEKKGLIERPETPIPGKYIYAITPKGKELLSK